MTFEKAYSSCSALRSKETTHSIVEETNFDLTSSLLSTDHDIMPELSTTFSLTFA